MSFCLFCLTCSNLTKHVFSCFFAPASGPQIWSIADSFHMPRGGFLASNCLKSQKFPGHDGTLVTVVLCFAIFFIRVSSKMGSTKMCKTSNQHCFLQFHWFIFSSHHFIVPKTFKNPAVRAEPKDTTSGADRSLKDLNLELMDCKAMVELTRS